MCCCCCSVKGVGSAHWSQKPAERQMVRSQNQPITARLESHVIVVFCSSSGCWSSSCRPGGSPSNQSRASWRIGALRWRLPWKPWENRMCVCRACSHRWSQWYVINIHSYKHKHDYRMTIKKSDKGRHLFWKVSCVLMLVSRWGSWESLDLMMKLTSCSEHHNKRNCCFTFQDIFLIFPAAVAACVLPDQVEMVAAQWLAVR